MAPEAGVDSSYRACAAAGSGAEAITAAASATAQALMIRGML